MNPSFLREDAARKERWAHLTEGVTSNNVVRNIVETLMDSQKSINEASTTTGDVSIFNKLSLALIRRIYQTTIANEIISTQPISAPVAKVFFLDFARASTQAPTVVGDRLDYEAAKMNKMYASGVITGEALGTGNGSATNFNTALYPLKTGSLVVKKDGVVVTNYTINEATGAIVFGTAPANATVLTASYALTMEGLGASGNAKIAKLKLTMSSATVDVETMKIGADWTVEAQQDFAAFGFGDMEAELSKQMGDQMRRDLDRMFIDDLLAGASAGNVNWSAAIPTGSTVKEYYETLVHAMNDAANLIYKKRLVAPNFVVMGPDVSNMLDKVNSFRYVGANPINGPTGTVNITSGPNVFGTISNKYKVILDPLFPAGKILLGYKGDNWNETGYVYSPYRMFETGTFIDPNTMQPVKSAMHRFGRYLVNGDFYATVTVTA